MYSPMVGHFSGFYLLAVGHNAAMNMDVQISVQIFVFQGLNMLGSCSALGLILELVKAFAFKLPHLLWIFLLITAPPLGVKILIIYGPWRFSCFTEPSSAIKIASCNLSGI